MPQEICPFCKSAVNEGADVCQSCGAQKGYGAAGQSKHKDAALFLTLVVLAAIFYSSGEPLIQFLLGGFLGISAFVVGLMWLAAQGQEAKWYR